MSAKAKSAMLMLGGILMLLAPSAQGATLKAGVAKVDITPPLGVAMWGYNGDLKPGVSPVAEGTRDPLYARVLVLEVGERRLALVTVDLGRCFGPTSLRRLREIAKQSSKISCLLVNASHTHAGPILKDVYPNGAPAWETAAITKIGNGIEDAASHLVEAQFGTGYGIAFIGHNRRRVNPDGTVTFVGGNETHFPTSPLDPTLLVLRVDTTSGKPLAILVNYACHAVILSNDNLRYSADFPGAMTRTVESNFGDQPPLCFYLQGGAGDINPDHACVSLNEDPVKWIEWSGQRLGQEAARVAKNIATQVVPEASMDYAEDVLTFHTRWDPEQLSEAVLKTVGPNIFDVFAPPFPLAGELQLPVTTLLINKQIALMSMPGEPYVDFQMNWRERCPVRDALFLGYTNGYFGYFPTIRAASEGGYGASSAMSYVEVTAGERMVDHCIARVYALLGRLCDIPDELKKN